MFKGIGQFSEPYNIKLKDNYQPVIHPVRRIPYSYRKKVLAEIDRMEKLGIISKVDIPTEFVNSMVTVKKRNKDDIRICLDPKDLNKQIMREHYPLKTREEILHEIGQPKYFTELDLTSAYWQIP